MATSMKGENIVGILVLFPIAYSAPWVRTGHYTIATIFVSEYKPGHALPSFRIRNQSSARTRCKLFLHRTVRWTRATRAVAAPMGAASATFFSMLFWYSRRS